MHSLRIVGLLALVTASTARADRLDATVRILPSSNGQPPRIEATIAGPPRAATAYAINAVGAPQIAPLEVRSERDGSLSGPQPIALALVYCGQMIWIGDEDYQADFPSGGALKTMEAAIDRADLAKQFPPGSLATAISYSTGVTVELPMGPIDRLSGRVLGNEKHYQDRIGSDLVLGVRAGLDALEQVHVPRRLMIVIGDGWDTDGEQGKIELGELRDRARDLDVQVVAIVSKSSVSPEGSGPIGVLASHVVQAYSVDAIATYLEGLPQRHARHYAVFPTIDPNTGVSLPLDGALHEIELHVGERSTTFPLAVAYSVPAPGDTPLKSAIGIAGLLAVVASIGFFVYTRRWGSTTR